MSINDSIAKVTEVKAAIRDLLTDFLKLIITVGSALLALLISLNQQLSGSTHLFHAALLLLLLSILCGVASLYIVLTQHRTMNKDLLAAISKQIRLGKDNFEPVYSRYNKLQIWIEAICLISFLLSIIVLVAYSLCR